MSGQSSRFGVSPCGNLRDAVREFFCIGMTGMVTVWSGHRRAILAALVLFIATVCSRAVEAGLVIVINPGAGLASNAQALAAFNNAANEWSSKISTNITVNINADLINFGNGSIIGSTSATMIANGYDTIRDAMAAHGAASPDLAILASLPTAAQFNGFLPAGFTFSGNIALTQANAKALGFSQLTPIDATINFNSQFSFAFNSGQLNGSKVDFQTVAAHEIGHALGFVSAVDFVDSNASGTVFVQPLDLFRFDAGNLPTNASTFTNNSRSLVPNVNAFTSDTINNLRMSTGANKGDGNQASHWKADEQTGLNLGIMDPTLASGVAFPVGVNDLRAMALIGYTLTAVPEPGSTILILVGVAMCYASRHISQRRASAQAL